MSVVARGRAWLILISTAASAVALSAQTQRDARTATPAPNGTGALAGVVTVADPANRPIRHANVVLIGAGTGTLRVTSTDDAGAWSRSRTCRPIATQSAPASCPTSAPWPGRGDRAAGLGSRARRRPQKITDVAIRLHPGASIAGTIVTEDGQPAARVTVGLHQRRLEGPAQVLAPDAAPTLTDDLGRFRFFGLATGRILRHQHGQWSKQRAPVDRRRRRRRPQGRGDGGNVDLGAVDTSATVPPACSIRAPRASTTRRRSVWPSAKNATALISA